MSKKEKEIRKLMKDARSAVEIADLKKAGKKLHQAIEIAKKTGNKVVLDQISEFIQEFTYSNNTQSIELNLIETDGFILDIGGGGEGVIGKLNGRQVVAIDKNERELEETRNEALKVVMDATDLKFLPESFDVCTSFFCLIYVPKNRHLKVFNEARRVLKNNGRFLLWDVRIPERFGDYKAFMVRLKVKLPNGEIETGYGVKWQTQDIDYFKEIARKAKFNIMSEWSKGEIFHLEMTKKT
ncbi:MAG: class I SAM-dependent methyltransferase [Candidatus Bathyarchaeota archaeon]|nr:class I SAM-dependent methyltransferase [Candidatus Bathyarchaeota archaeon]MDH5787765.1 class I SAM-dependent methyltransferase [Candidatus Bathyarchaeota archaeon]